MIDFSSHGFSVMHNASDIVTPRKLETHDPSEVIFLEYDEKELEIFKISKIYRRKQLLPFRFKAVEKFIPSNVILHYLDMIDTLSDWLQPVNPNRILKTLESIVCSAIYGITYFSADFIRRLRECTTTSLLRILFSYTNWYDHSIIRELVEACDCPEGIKLLDEFDSRIDVTQPITEYPISKPIKYLLDVKERSSYTVMVVKCEQQLSALPLQYIEEVKSQLRSKFCISKYTCILLAVENDKSATFYWSIPRSIESLIINAVEEFSSYLHDNGLLEIRVCPNFLFTTGKKVEQSHQSKKLSVEVHT